MSAFKSVVHQGHHAYQYSAAPVSACPYPANSQTAKDWVEGWYKAQQHEPWGEPLRKNRRRSEVQG